ncbi:hypothetical protein MLD38_040920 [Melastoma candidum]|nr:hypothetical protein MLD38_040920 [Melastoma candidum]
MAQYRQFGYRDHDLHPSNGGPPPAATSSSDHYSLGVRSSSSAPHHHQLGKPGRARRFGRSDRGWRLSVGSVILVLFVGLSVTSLAYFLLLKDGRDSNSYQGELDDSRYDSDFLTNVTRTEGVKVLGFGRGSVTRGRDSRYWDKDDRRRDEDYNEDAVEHVKENAGESMDGEDVSAGGRTDGDKSLSDDSGRVMGKRGAGLYNEAGRNELKMYEAEYEAALKNSGQSNDEGDHKSHLSDAELLGVKKDDADNEYEDLDSLEDLIDEHQEKFREFHDHLTLSDSQKKESNGKSKSTDESSEIGSEGRNVAELSDEVPRIFYGEESSDSRESDKIKTRSQYISRTDGQMTKKLTKKRPKRYPCEMKLSNATAMIVEPVEGRKFARFYLQYVQEEEKPLDAPEWEPRFAGHQSLQQREESFSARDQTIHCGFIKGSKNSQSTGFDLSEDDASYISRCHVAVTSCIFGNSDRLRIPAKQMISRQSRKNVCFVMFVDEVTLETLTSEGSMLDTMGFIGLWKIVVVKNLPYDDMRRVGKIPKFLTHRLFPSARYSIWLDSKLRLQLDPILLLEYFLWRKGFEYAISNHYDRHCVWEEVAQNKKLNKYNHTVIDQQFTFYQSDGLKRFNPLDPAKLLPSNVPEGSFIVRAHTPMSNLFSCLWFNEVDRFTPRDQLSFAYTYHKLRRTNPGKPFYLNMFKDCERRRVAKLFHHRSEEKRNIHQGGAV